jgi:hypothetical protein
MDTIVPILSGGLLAIAFATTGILVVMVGLTWQLILIIIPLSWIYYSYQVSTQQIKSLFLPSFLPSFLWPHKYRGVIANLCVFGWKVFLLLPNYKLRINVTI